MKVTGIRTVRLPEHPQMLWLEVLTDEEITGMGETCLGPATVEAYLHETVAPYLTGQDPLRIAAHRRGLYDMFVGYEGTGAETRGNSAVDVALWGHPGASDGAGRWWTCSAARKRNCIRIYNTCAGYRYGRGNRGALRASDRATAADRGLPGTNPPGPYEDLQAAIERPGELAQDLLEQGIRGMKVWPFDPYAAATGGHDISPADLRAGVQRDPADPGRRGRRHGHPPGDARRLAPARSHSHREGGRTAGAVLVRGRSQGPRPGRRGALRGLDACACRDGRDAGPAGGPSGG